MPQKTLSGFCWVLSKNGILWYYSFCFLWVTFPYILPQQNKQVQGVLALILSWICVKYSQWVRRAMLTICTVVCMSHRQMTMNRKMQSIMLALSSQTSSHVPTSENLWYAHMCKQKLAYFCCFCIFSDPSVTQGIVLASHCFKWQ